MVPSKLIVEICAPNGIFRAPIKHEHNKSSSRAQIDILQPKTKNQSHAEDKVSSTGPCSRLFFCCGCRCFQSHWYCCQQWWPKASATCVGTTAHPSQSALTHAGQGQTFIATAPRSNRTNSENLISGAGLVGWGRGSIRVSPLPLTIWTHRIILSPGGGYSLKIIAHCTANKPARSFAYRENNIYIATIFLLSRITISKFTVCYK